MVPPCVSATRDRLQRVCHFPLMLSRVRVLHHNSEARRPLKLPLGGREQEFLGVSLSCLH